VAAAALALLGGCERELRRFDAPPATPGGAPAPHAGTLHPGPSASAARLAASAPHDAPPAQANPHEHNAYAVAQGKRLYRWYNCNGCHANGGGGMGPPLMDAEWRYGSAAHEIVATILRGRPGGMPAFAGRIPEDQAWQIAAYVRSMSGQLRADVLPGRADSLSPGEPEVRRDKLAPRPASSPP
jgi:cytochrome c oxidase cbb3-type subunit 3